MTTDIGADPALGKDAIVMGSSTSVPVPLKRPPRKLSLTSPILGFVKKEKNKEKEKTFPYEKVTERNAKESNKARAKDAEDMARAKARRMEEPKRRDQNELPLVPDIIPSYAFT
jgi:ubiquitin carboxyl-terminal hydrolase 9/13